MRLRMLSHDQSKTIYRASLRILREVGMDVRDLETRKRRLQGGCVEG